MSASRRLVQAAARIAFPHVDPTRRAVIIGYHSIHPSAPYASATPAEFEQHLDWLQAHCSLVALDRIRVPLAADRPRVALTFDDGFVDNFESAFPSLRTRGLTATFFLTIGFVERTPDVLARMARLWRTPDDEIAPLDWGEVDAMHRSGMAFGSHTMSHPNLAAIDGATARRELRDSKHRLEDRLQVPIASLAYPFGKLRHHVTSRTVDLARECRIRAGGQHARARDRGLGRRHVPATDRHRERHGLAAGREGAWAPSIGMPTCASDCHGRCRSVRSRVGVDDDERCRRRACRGIRQRAASRQRDHHVVQLRPVPGRGHRERSRTNVFAARHRRRRRRFDRRNARPSLERMQHAAWPMSGRRESEPRVLATPASE